MQAPHYCTCVIIFCLWLLSSDSLQQNHWKSSFMALPAASIQPPVMWSLICYVLQITVSLRLKSALDYFSISMQQNHWKKFFRCQACNSKSVLAIYYIGFLEISREQLHTLFSFFKSWCLVMRPKLFCSRSSCKCCTRLIGQAKLDHRAIELTGHRCALTRSRPEGDVVKLFFLFLFLIPVVNLDTPAFYQEIISKCKLIVMYLFDFPISHANFYTYRISNNFFLKMLSKSLPFEYHLCVKQW